VNINVNGATLAAMSSCVGHIGDSVGYLPFTKPDGCPLSHVVVQLIQQINDNNTQYKKQNRVCIMIGYMTISPFLLLHIF